MKDRFAEIDSLITQGQLGAAQAALRDLPRAKVPRTELAPLARLLWRAGLPELGLRLLRRVVRPESPAGGSATAAERAEYAQCLLRVGASDEGERLLSTVDASEVPSVHLYRAGLCVSRWDYAGSVAPLVAYLKTPELPPYQALVAKTNLAAAMLRERELDKAKVLLRELLYTTSLRKNRLLLGRVLELAAESHVVRHDWTEARRFLDEADRKIGDSAMLDAFFIKKYRAVVDLLERGPVARDALLEVRTEAAARQHWETVRDCDRFLAIGLADHELFRRVYFGTPYPEYRRKLLEDLPAAAATIGTDFLWNPHGSGKPGAVLDLFDGSLDGAEVVAPGSQPHRLLLALASDFYRPARLAEIHGLVNPGAYYNPTTSPRAVHETIRRLRSLLDERDIPLSVDTSGPFYRLVAAAPIALRVRLDAAGAGKRYAPWLERLRAEIGDEPFAIATAMRHLGEPRRTTQRMLQEAVDSGDLERTGKTKSTLYRIRKRAA